MLPCPDRSAGFAPGEFDVALDDLQRRRGDGSLFLGLEGSHDRPVNVVGNLGRRSPDQFEERLLQGDHAAARLAVAGWGCHQAPYGATPRWAVDTTSGETVDVPSLLAFPAKRRQAGRSPKRRRAVRSSLDVARRLGGAELAPALRRQHNSPAHPRRVLPGPRPSSGSQPSGPSAADHGCRHRAGSAAPPSRALRGVPWGTAPR